MLERLKGRASFHSRGTKSVTVGSRRFCGCVGSVCLLLSVVVVLHLTGVPLGPITLPPAVLPQWLQEPGPLNEKRTLFCDMVCFLFITPLAAISGWLCLRGAQDHLHLGSWLQAVGLITLTIALFTIYVLWTLVSPTAWRPAGGAGR